MLLAPGHHSGGDRPAGHMRGADQRLPHRRPCAGLDDAAPVTTGSRPWRRTRPLPLLRPWSGLFVPGLRLTVTDACDPPPPAAATTARVALTAAPATVH